MILPAPGHDTRVALVRAAERLIAQRGLGTVSVKDITKEAGARNPSAVHYHFGNIEELIKEVFAQRFTKIEIERLKLFAALETADPEDRLYALLEAALAPLFETCLEEEGRLYVQFCRQFVCDPRFELAELVDEVSMVSLEVLTKKLAKCLPDLPEDVFATRLRQGFLVSIIQAAANCE